tara:strand:+ start:34 stop:699 length:666 start_codon:yes stop_codon:yes gene_type:complete
MLNKFKNIHNNKDIYIIASGKSLDFIDNSFFNNKITIGINQVYKKFITTYLVRKEFKLLDEILKKNLKLIHFISKGEHGGNNNNNIFIVNKYKNNKNIIIYNHNINNHLVEQLPDDNKLLVSYSTITTGIHLAAYMGAKNIILVGHDCGTLNGEPNFKGYHTDSTYKIAHKNGKKDYINWLKKIENGTIKLKKLLKEKYGCNIYSLNPFINFGLEGNVYNK